MRILLLLGLITRHVASSAISTDPIQQPNETTPILAGRCFQVLAENTRGNVIYSPMSFHLILSMIFGSSSEDTKKRLHVHSTGPQYSARRDPKLWNGNFTNDAVQYDVQTTILQTQDFCLPNDFVGMLENYHVNIDNVDFTKPDDRRRVENDRDKNRAGYFMIAIFEKTRFMPVLLLSNTIDFKSDWAQKFNVMNTKDRVFYGSNMTKMVPTMRNVGMYKTVMLPMVNARSIVIPLNPRNHSTIVPRTMIIIVPFKHKGLPHLIENLHKVNLRQLRRGRRVMTELHLPKFKLISTNDLIPCFNKYGLEDLLTNLTIFDSISSTMQLKINNVVQKNIIEVDERGMQATSEHVSEPVVEQSARSFFHVDRSFMGLILTGDGIPVYTFSVTDPSSKL